jgi:hypothetical protein
MLAFQPPATINLPPDPCQRQSTPASSPRRDNSSHLVCRAPITQIVAPYKEIVQVVLSSTKRVIEVDRAHHGNVGYAGSWDAAYWLVTPASLSRMKAEGPVKGGIQRYTARQEEQM